MGRVSRVFALALQGVCLRSGRSHWSDMFVHEANRRSLLIGKMHANGGAFLARALDSFFFMTRAHSPQSGLHATCSARRCGTGHRGTPAKRTRFFRLREGATGATGRSRARGLEGVLPRRLPIGRGRPGEPGAKSRRLSRRLA